MNQEERVVEYHTDHWGDMVEQGWITKQVDDLNGKRIATMIWPRRDCHGRLMT